MRHEHGVERFTYRELDRLAAQAAGVLRALGVVSGDRCAILAENSARWCAAYLGILRLGAIAVPFDTSYKPAQVTTLLRDSGAKILFASSRLEAVAREGAGDARIVPLTAWEGSAPAESECPSRPADPAVILYTSGTTADPKGVVLTHGNLLAEREGALEIVSVSERDAILGVLPLFHALAQLANLLLPFSAGAHVVFLDTLNTRELLRALDEEGITIFVCVPQFFYLIHQRITGEVAKRGAVARLVFKTLVRTHGALRGIGVNAGAILFRRVHRTLGPRMRLLITGGSKFDGSVGKDLHDLGLTILQAYGLTETSGAATITRPGEPIDTVGRALSNVEIATAPAGDGLDGEVLIRGPIVMAGYWNRPDATAAVLHDGWLHTGDLGRIDAQGRLTITGRSKEVIVLSSGKNVYPEDVEAHYRQSAFIKELCVLGVSSPGEPSSERLHAIVVPDLDVMRERKIVNTSELIRFELEGLSIALPPHRRVLGFEVWMAPLARTTTGKLKRHEIMRQWRARVPAPRDAGRDAGDGACERADAAREAGEGLEPHVAQVIGIVRSMVRGGAEVRPDSNLELDLGVDSMERVELLALLEQRLGVPVPEEVAQTAFLVRDLAEAFRGASGDASAAGEPAWATLLDVKEPGPELQALTKPRSLAAPLLFVGARVLTRVLARPRVSGVELIPGQGPFIISPNHQSYLDPLVLLGVLPYAVFRQLFSVGAAEYFQTPLTAWLAKRLNVVPVDPDANLLPAMQAGAFGLREGKILVLFPEGERSIDGTVKRFKKGAAILSQHLEVPVVPVAIAGVFEIWGRNRPFDWRKLLPWSGHRVHVRFGEPLPPGQGPYAEETATLRAAVERMWNAISSSAARSA